MTETYNGPWNPVTGDSYEKKVQDVYHRYPTGKPAGILNKPLVAAYRVVAISPVQTEANGK